MRPALCLFKLLSPFLAALILFRGAAEGYAAVLAALIEALHAAQGFHSSTRTTLDDTSASSVESDTALRAFARTLLRSGNRTNSGGEAYESLGAAPIPSGGCTN